MAKPSKVIDEERYVQFRENVSQPVVAAFCAGGVAGAVSRTVVSPLERLKILMQVQSAGREAYKLSVGQALGKMWKEEGWRGFMRGNGTNCIRIVPYSAVQFSSYNFYKRVRQGKPSSQTHTRANRCRTYSRRHPVLICRPSSASFAVASQASRPSSSHTPSTLSAPVCPSSQLASPSWVTGRNNYPACGRQ